MKLKTKLISGLVAISSMSIPLIGIVSCNDHTPIATLTWSPDDGAFVYDSSIQLKEIKDADGNDVPINIETANQIYFEDIQKNPNIFTNDLMYMWATGEHFLVGIGGDVLPVQFVIDSITINYYGCNAKENRLSYDINIQMAPLNEEESGSGVYRFESHNGVFSLLDGRSDAFGIFPKQIVDFILDPSWPVVDPLFPGDEMWAIMFSCYDNWEFSMQEKYEMPEYAHPIWELGYDWTNKSHRLDHNFHAIDDPEQFDMIKQYFYYKLFEWQSYYFQNVIPRR